MVKYTTVQLTYFMVKYKNQMQRRGIVAIDLNSESCWVMRNSGREIVNSPWSSRLNIHIHRKVGQDGPPPLSGKILHTISAKCMEIMN